MSHIFSSRKTKFGKWLVAMAILLFAQPVMGGTKHILFIAGDPSHGFGNHEHYGGSTLLAETIRDANLGIQTRVIRGWPEDPSAFDDADAVVIFSNGGERHPAMGHLDEFDKIMERGVGLVTLHFAVEIPKGEPGNKLLKWSGGYFETHWSVNPFWTARFDEFPDHPITNGVRPFVVHDEWYYHMRFVNNLDNVTPILTDLPPKETLERDDGPHHNNPHVRQAIFERQEPQHVAWAYERPGNRGRAFGFTGGHYHWSWGMDDYRRLVVNAIVWTAGSEVPDSGVPVKPVNVLELAETTYEEIPDDWDYREIQDMLDKANDRTTILD